MSGSLRGMPSAALDELAPPSTPWELHAGHWCKRDDLFEYAGVRGGKVRTCRAIAAEGIAAGGRGLVTAGSRHSPQVNIVAHVARHLGVPAVAFVPAGPPGAEVEAAAAAGATIMSVRPGHNTVIKARARDYAQAHGYVHVPFGMEHAAAIASATQALTGGPWGKFDRLVVPVGSGMTLAGILCGMAEVVPPPLRPAVVGVAVGGDPGRRLDRWAPPMWRFACEEQTSELRYDQPAPRAWQHALGFPLDPIYEAKCWPFLEPGDALWVVGHRGH